MNKHETKYYNTAQRIKAAFIDLLESKTFSDISISEVCNKANIHRSTFYAHYDNTVELIIDLERSLMYDFFNKNETLAKIITNSVGTSLQNNMSMLNSILAECLEYIKEHRQLFILYDEGVFNNGNELPQYINEYLIMPSLKAYGITDETVIEYVTIYFISGLNSLINKWLREDCKKSVEEICQIVQRCFNLTFHY